VKTNVHPAIAGGLPFGNNAMAGWRASSITSASSRALMSNSKIAAAHHANMKIIK
jgi:hypothetical protein